MRMADYCKQCSVQLFGEDYRELAGLCSPGEVAHVICEGCGFVTVDPDGVCQGGEGCMENHERKGKP